MSIYKKLEKKENIIFAGVYEGENKWSRRHPFFSVFSSICGIESLYRRALCPPFWTGGEERGARAGVKLQTPVENEEVMERVINVIWVNFYVYYLYVYI